MAFGRTRWLGDGYWDGAVSVNADPIRHAGFVTGCAAVNERWVTGMEARRVRVCGRWVAQIGQARWD